LKATPCSPAGAHERGELLGRWDARSAAPNLRAETGLDAALQIDLGRLRSLLDAGRDLDGLDPRVVELRRSVEHDAQPQITAGEVGEARRRSDEPPQHPGVLAGSGPLVLGQGLVERQAGGRKERRMVDQLREEGVPSVHGVRCYRGWTKNSPSRLRFRPLIRRAFRLPVQPVGWSFDLLAPRARRKKKCSRPDTTSQGSGERNLSQNASFPFSFHLQRGHAMSVLTTLRARIRRAGIAFVR
jgi:hypothetical protein